jgi:AcrR family transcriptional regulator
MPKIVNHEERKKQIAQATWRVILKSGMEGASVRNIAKEGGFSLGALRHYFSTQEELLVYAMNLVKDQARERINEILITDLPPKEKVLRLLLEIVPTNKQTLVEMEVWFAFTFHFRNKKGVYDPKHDGIYEGIKRIITFMDNEKLLKNGIDKDIEAEKLYAIIDGIALHAFLEKERLNKERIVQVLTSYLDSIFI